MSDEKGTIATITNSGTIGAMAVGSGATAVQAGGNVSLNQALDGQFAALAHLIDQHDEVTELKALFEEAVKLSKSDNPSSSKPIWEKIATYGGAIGSLVGGITSTIALLQ